MKIGLHDWEPGLSTEEGKKASSGGSEWKRYLIAQLNSAGHEVYWFGQGTPAMTHRASRLDARKMDVLLFIWRWLMHPSYRDRNDAYLTQCGLLDECQLTGVPNIICDLDHKISSADLLSRLGDYRKTILVAPELFPRKGFRKLLFPNPYKMMEPDWKTPTSREFDLVYVGNNYERWEQFVKYVAPLPKLGIMTAAFGNWLEPGPDRESPLAVMEIAEGIFFGGRVSNNEVVATLRRGSSTIHLAKESYCQTGFVTMRWAEAAAAGIMSLLPAEFRNAIPEFSRSIVRNAEELAVQEIMTGKFLWTTEVKAQQTWVEKNMRIEPWLDIVEEAARL